MKRILVAGDGYDTPNDGALVKKIFKSILLILKTFEENGLCIVQIFVGKKNIVRSLPTFH